MKSEQFSANDPLATSVYCLRQLQSGLIAREALHLRSAPEDDADADEGNTKPSPSVQFNPAR